MELLLKSDHTKLITIGKDTYLCTTSTFLPSVLVIVGKLPFDTITDLYTSYVRAENILKGVLTMSNIHPNG